jgi:hypothetical protein
VYKLNLPEYQFNLSRSGTKPLIFDRYRKKYVVLTPEEWVRQNFLMYLTSEKNYPHTLISVEASLDLFKVKKRTDIVVYNRQAEPLLIVECKAPGVEIDTAVFEQVIRYNMALKAKYLILTNGLKHFCCRMNYSENNFHFLNEIPDYKNLLQ